MPNVPAEFRPVVNFGNVAQWPRFLSSRPYGPTCVVAGRERARTCPMNYSIPLK